MKNIFKTIMLTAAAAVAFTACNKEAENSFAPKAEPLRIVVKATPDDLLTEAGTKTYIDNSTNSILWGENEIMQIGVNDGTATAFGTSIEGYKDYWNGSAQALFAFDITPANTVEKYTLYGLYPASAVVASSNTDPANYKVKLPATQTASLSSYDPKAYILVAKPETDVELDPTETMWTASFRRATALNKITLTGLSTSEPIIKVELTAPTGKYLAGSRKINLTTGESGDIYDGGGKTESITVKLSQGATDHLDLWFTSWGVEITEGQVLKVVAYSAAHTYTREVTIPNGRSIKFQEGCLNTATISMSDAVEGVNTTLNSGNYVILAKNTSNNVDYYYALKSEAESTRMAFESYTGDLSGYNGDAALVWTVSESDGAYIIEANGDGKSGKLLGWTSGNTAAINAPGESWTSTNYLLDIDWDSTNSCYHISVNADPTRILAKNTASSTGFAFYAGTQYKNIIFVPATIDNRTPVTLSFAEDAINLDSSEVGSFAGQDLVVDPNVTAITENVWWEYKDDPGVVDDFDSGVIELTGNAGSVTVTAHFDGDENYKAAEASYTITVTDSSTPTPTGCDDQQLDQGKTFLAHDSFPPFPSGVLLRIDLTGNRSRRIWRPDRPVPLVAVKITRIFRPGAEYDVSVGIAEIGAAFMPGRDIVLIASVRGMPFAAVVRQALTASVGIENKYRRLLDFGNENRFVVGFAADAVPSPEQGIYRKGLERGVRVARIIAVHAVLRVTQVCRTDGGTEKIIDGGPSGGEKDSSDTRPSARNISLERTTV